MLSDAELIDLIEGGENDRVEFTALVKDLDKIRIAICGFANDLPDHKQPGVLFIGLNDDGSCANLTIDDDLMQRVGGVSRDGKTHPFPNAVVAKKELQGCQIAVIQVEPSENPPVRVDGRCWIRSGPRREQATAEDERRLTEKRRWGSLPYDMHGVPNTTVGNDIDILKFQSEYLPSAVSREAQKENQRTSEEQMTALRLVALDGTPTVTAILMLGTDPMYWFPGAYIQFVRYDGTEITDSVRDHATLSGTLPEQLTAAEILLNLNIVKSLSISGARHTNKQSYPYDALRELVHNAVIHRNYENSNTPVRITWLEDRVEVISPGSAYGIVSRENFGTANLTAYRNPTIAEAMKNLGFIEHFGRGIAKARRALEINGNPPLEFDVQDNFILATIRRRQ